MSVLSQLGQLQIIPNKAICSSVNQTSTLAALLKDKESEDKCSQTAQACILSSVDIPHDINQQVTFSEESNSFEINFTILFVEDNLNLNFQNKISKISALIEECKQEQLNSGNFCVKLLGDDIILMKFMIYFLQKENSKYQLNKMILPGVRLLNSYVAFKEFMVVLPQRVGIQNNSTILSYNNKNSLQLTIDSFTHQFIFDKKRDSFQISLRIENPLRVINYQCFFHFGLFMKSSESKPSSSSSNSFKIAVQSQVIQQLLNQCQIKEGNIHKQTYLKQEDLQVDEELIPQISDLSSTKSNNIITSPLMLPLSQDQQFAQILRMKYESSDSNEEIKLDQINESGSDNKEQDHNNPQGMEQQQQKQLEHQQQLSRKPKFDKKNVVKNFVKAFDSYFLDYHRNYELTQILGISLEKLTYLRQLIDSIEKSLKYNNKMIIQIVNSELNTVFKLFLNTQALHWINNSSVFDKSAHRTILKDYIAAANNPQEIYKIVNLRVRNRMSTKK